MKILLVSPECPDTFWNFSHVLKLTGKKSAFPPLGLITVAAMLPAEWTLRLVDLEVRPLTDDDLRWADAVFVSAMIVHEASVREIVARSHAANTPVVAGGPLFTTGADRFPEIECCVIGEAEDLMDELAADLAAGVLKPRYRAETRPDLTRTPLPRWDLIDADDYLTLSVQCSRGCPFDCEFCDITAVYGRVPRVKSPDRLVAELDAALASGWGGAVFIVDDNFIGNRAKAKGVLRALIDWRADRGAKNGFITEASINLVDDPELLALMVDAGFRHVFIGIETPSEESLKECRKVQNTNRDLAEAVRTIHRAGIEVMAGFIVGFDADRPDVFEKQRRFIQDAGIVTAMVGLLTALPGTRLFSRLTLEGRMLRESTGNNLDSVLNFKTTLDPKLLVDGYRDLVRTLYEPGVYYERIRIFLRDYRPTARITRCTRADLRAFIASIWTVGLANPGRLDYWKLLGLAAARHPRAFGQAVELAIRGHHFRTIARSI